MRSAGRFLTMTVLAALVCTAAAVFGAYLHYHFEVSRHEKELQSQLDEAHRRQIELQDMLTRLKESRRIAQIMVRDQTRSGDGKVQSTELVMVQLGRDGKALSRQCFRIPGDRAYFEGEVVKFDEDCIATAHPLRGQNIALLTRVFSDRMEPRIGFPIDESGEIPAPYRRKGENSSAKAFEQEIWKRFWELCNDPALAREYGVRVAQCETVSKPMKPGVLYELSIDANGGLNLNVKALPEAVAEVLWADDSDNSSQ